MSEHNHVFDRYNDRTASYLCACGDSLSELEMAAGFTVAPPLGYIAIIGTLRGLLMRMWASSNDVMLDPALRREVLAELAGIMPAEDLEQALAEVEQAEKASQIVSARRTRFC